MKAKILGLLTMGIACCLFAVGAEAAIISGTWNFTAFGFSPTAPTDPVIGTFSFSGLDTSQTYLDSTGAGFSISMNLNTTGDGGAGFNYYPSIEGGLLQLGGLCASVGTVARFSCDFDWAFAFTNFASSPIFLAGAYTGPTTYYNTVTGTPVPEPATLALLGVGLAGLGFTRRRSFREREAQWSIK